ncbi:MAG TPA: CBS domain-containing protein [Acidobacteriota bacterium]|nr:CBS domain-containing protein [Acidobacteriota bacterium]HRR26939.1 CBS domain-containing protein [Acidobacteriota bacterium]HRV08238.1 CBS domain-containing protein [Acidobacteriota bacterium]
MNTVREILQNKGNAVFSVCPSDTVYRALKVLAEKNVGAVMVLEKQRLVGIFSERDYARKVVLRGKSSRETLIHEVMTTPVAFVRPENTVEECMALMTDRHIRHLPVMEEGRLVGVVSIGDVVYAKISEQDFHIRQLVSYITGSFDSP